MSDTFDWQSLSSSGTAEAAPSSAPTTKPTRAEVPGVADVSPERISEALEMLEGVAGGLAGLRAQLAAVQGATVTATSGGRHVTVSRKRSGSGLTVQIDERWLDNAHERAISRELLEALQAARDEAARPSAVLAEDGPIGQLRALTASPASLLGWLGLPLPAV